MHCSAIWHSEKIDNIFHYQFKRSCYGKYCLIGFGGLNQGNKCVWTRRIEYVCKTMDFQMYALGYKGWYFLKGIGVPGNVRPFRIMFERIENQNQKSRYKSMREMI